MRIFYRLRIESDRHRLITGVGLYQSLNGLLIIPSLNKKKTLIGKKLSCGPAGLDIGSENPEQIALSILSEIQAVLNGLTAAPLKSKPVIHDRNNEQRVVHQ